jgi:medium-chain acyl-[acyl-carrier-protein] hydrolase
MNPQTNNNPWVTFPRPNPSALLRLFCLPYAGGGASAYRLWPEGLPSFVEVCPVQLPGRERRTREPLFTEGPPLVEAIGQAILPLLNKPFALFGHSLGAMLSFELARYLRRRHGIEPLQLFVSGRGAPQLPARELPIHALPEKEFIAELANYEGTPQEVLEHAELMQLLLPILRADFRINETYTYTPGIALGCPLSAFGGQLDQKVSREELEGWGAQTTADFSVRMYPGGHFFTHTDRPSLLRDISRDLLRLASRLGWQL